MHFVYSEIFSGLKMGGGYFQYQAPQLRILPITDTSEENKKKLEDLVDKIIELYEKLNLMGSVRTDQRARLEDDIAKADKSINDLVYEIYKITDDEKETIETQLNPTSAPAVENKSG